MDTDGRFTTPTTRRTIVWTGVKLAYAVPVVAASVKLSATNAAAAISHPSTCGPSCEPPGCFCGPGYPSGAPTCVGEHCWGFRGIDCGERGTNGFCPDGAVCVDYSEIQPGQVMCAMPCGVPCPCAPPETGCGDPPRRCCSGFVCSSPPGIPGICV